MHTLTSEEMLANPEAAAEALFMRSLHDKSLPEELTVGTVLEALSHPNHFPVVVKLLQLFGKSSKTTFKTERNCTHCPDSTKKEISTRYNEEWENKTPRATKYPLSQHNHRLQALLRSHDTGWSRNGPGQKALYLLGEVFAKQLGYDLDIDDKKDAHKTGDFHLIVVWLIKNMDQIGPVFFREFNINAAAAKIAHSKFVSIDHTGLNKLVADWDEILGPINLETVRLDKPKVNDPTTAEAFPRAGETTIVRDFRQIFVDLDLNDLDAVAEFCDEDDELSKADLKNFTRQMNVLHLTMLGLIQDTGADQKPLQDLTIRLKEPLESALILLHETIATHPKHSIARRGLLKTIDLSLAGKNLTQVITSLVEKTKESSYPGFGAARALLTHYTELRIKKDPAADQIEKLMHHITQIALKKRTDLDFKLIEFTNVTE